MNTSPEGWWHMLAYAGCALAVAGATGGLGVVAAAVGCVLLLNE